jgi:Ca2+-transporting ATPase
VADNPRVKEFPFNSERKMMSIVRERGNIKTSYVKGASSFIVERCTRELIGDRVVPLNQARRDELISISRRMESSGLRVLGFAFRQLTVVDEKNAEYHLTFVGFAGMIDPPRPEVKQAIQEALDAGIKIKIITGDSALTTKAIANKVGLDGEIIEGSELDLLPDDKWDEIVRTRTIFARVTPRQKLRVVETLKRQNETVAVTGDGVNDILALKRADIGVAMGVRGSDVARDSSDIVLLDDNFASIIGAVKQGRRVFDNLRKSLMFLLSANMGEVLVIAVSLLFGYPLIFLPLAILWMNLVTDSLPALALAVEPEDRGIMKRAPRTDGLLRGIWRWAVVGGFLCFASVFLMFVWASDKYGLEIARTMAINVAIFFELFFVFSCKSKEPLIRRGLLNNKWLIGAVLLSAALQIIVVYTSVGHLFGFIDLSLTQLAISIGVALNGMILFEIWKTIRYSRIFRR